MRQENIIQQYEKLNEEVYTTDMTSSYRKYDEAFIHTKAYKHIAGIIRQTLHSLPSGARVLDVGCGTGRYFHLLDNISTLTGIDVSHNMLEQARFPFRRELIPVNDITLIEGNFYHYDFGAEKFDFIYSIGVLGEHVPFDTHICNRLFELLNEDGKLLFTVVDIEPRKNLKRKLAERLYPILPGSIKKVLDKRWETCYMTYDQLNDIMKQSGFSSYTITRYVSEDPKWEGVHLECVATR